MTPQKRANTFPKSARLLKPSDFRFKRFQKLSTRHFLFVYTNSGKGRLGISAAKKIIRLSVGRNRIKRLLREAFRRERFRLGRIDVHVVFKPSLGGCWRTLSLEDILADFERLKGQLETER